MIDKEIIKSYLESGLSVVPVNGDNGSTPKAPAVKEWASLQKERTKEENIEPMFSHSGGIGIIGGGISGNLTIIDFDNHDAKAKDRFHSFIISLKEIVQKYEIPYESTPSGGYHFYFRSSSSEGNKKLAKILIKTKKDTIIETRAEGGYVVSAPTRGYKVLFGNLEKIPTITEEEKDYIFHFCTSFDETKEPESEPVLYKNQERRPGDEYNISDRAVEEIPVLLERSGWKKAYNKYWVRPGKKVSDGISATFGRVSTPNGIPLFHVFSSNADPFEDGKNYTPFSVFTILCHKGDYSNAARELLGDGFGEQKDYNTKEEYLPKEISDRIEKGDRRIKQYAAPIVEEKRGKKKKSPIVEAKDFLSSAWEFRLNIINNTIQARKNGQRAWSDINENDIWMDVNEYGIKMSKDNVKSILGSSFVPEYNPFKEYFENLPEYDGVDYFGELVKYMDIDDNLFFRDMLEKHCVRAIKCSLEDEYYNRMIFTIQSEKQEIGKSRFVHWLNPFGNQYYSEQQLSESKDCQIALSQTFIYNMDELHEVKNKNSSFIKSVLSKYAVFERKPYAAQNSLMPRRCTFFASTNRAEFLTDSVNTRWLVFKVDAIKDELWSNVNVNDLWAQAWALYNENDYNYELTIEEKKKREDRNKSFMDTPVETGLILKYFEPSEDEWMLISDIIRELVIRAGYGIRITTSPSVISEQLDTLGFESEYTSCMNSKIKQYKIRIK